MCDEKERKASEVTPRFLAPATRKTEWSSTGLGKGMYGTVTGRSEIQFLLCFEISLRCSSDDVR